VSAKLVAEAASPIRMKPQKPKFMVRCLTMNVLPEVSKGERGAGFTFRFRLLICRSGRLPPDPVRNPLLQGAFWLLLGIYGSFGFCRATFLAHVAAYTQDLGFTLSDGAFITALISGASIAGRVGTGGLSDRLGNRAALAVSFGITTAAILLALAAGSLWILYLFGLAFGFAWGAQAVLRFTATSEAFGFSSLGFLLGLLSFIEAMAAMLGSYMGGYVFDYFGNYRPIFWAGAIIAVLGGTLSLFLRKRPQSS